MTHMTDQERVSLPLDLVNDLLALCTPEDHELRERVKQAARRAQVVPVPELTSTVVNDACWKFVEAMPHQLPGPIFNDLKPALYEALRLYHDAVLAAAPQPPEAACNPSMQPELATKAAPVQLPEPAASAYMSEPKDDGTVCTEMMVNPGLCTTGWNMLYTEQQVRQLMAAHGIQEQST